MSEQHIPLTAIVLSHNEAQNLSRCLSALRSCAEVIVVDDGSDDGSPDMARKHGARVVEHPFTSFADQRNWALHSAGCGFAWTLHLDADEVMTVPALEEIRVRIRSMSENQVGYLARKIMLNDRWLKYSADYPVYVARLVHRRGPRFEMGGHGEIINAPTSDAVFLDEPMLHYAFSKGWPDWYRKHDRYAADEAARLLATAGQGTGPLLWSADPVQRRRVLRSLSYRIPARPLFRFLYQYVWRRGFLDGVPGYQFARAMARYEAMINQHQRRLRREATEQ